MVGGLAIRQPAVIYLLQRELWSADGDAFASGLELATRLFAQVAASAGRLPRLSQRELTAAMEAVRQGACDRQTVRRIRDQIDELPVVLTRAEEDAVATAIAALLWAVERCRLPAPAQGDERHHIAAAREVRLGEDAADAPSPRPRAEAAGTAAMLS